MKDNLCKEMGKLSERLARIEGLLKGSADYEAVAERLSGGEGEPK